MRAVGGCSKRGRRVGASSTGRSFKHLRIGRGIRWRMWVSLSLGLGLGLAFRIWMPCLTRVLAGRTMRLRRLRGCVWLTRTRTRRASVCQFADVRRPGHDIAEAITLGPVEIALALSIAQPPLQLAVHRFQPLQTDLLLLLALLLPLPEPGRGARVALPFLIRLLGGLLRVHRHKHLLPVAGRDRDHVLAFYHGQAPPAGSDKPWCPRAFSQ
jgi:hypothetical protein